MYLSVTGFSEEVRILFFEGLRVGDAHVLRLIFKICTTRSEEIKIRAFYGILIQRSNSDLLESSTKPTLLKTV